MAVSRKKAQVLERLSSREGLSDHEREVLREAAGVLRGTSRRRAGESRKAARQRRSGGGPDAPAPSETELDAILWTDGAARGNPGPAGVGAVVKTADGQTLATCSEYLGCTTNNVAEYRALLVGLKKALGLGLRRIEIRADSELLIKQLTGQYRVKNERLVPMFQEAKRLLSSFEYTRLKHVRRELNGEADRLANQGIDSA